VQPLVDITRHDIFRVVFIDTIYFWQ
jgi:hypothetical protein